MSRVDDLVAELGLTPHPEGGYYRETFRSAIEVTRGGDRRSALTAIYYLLGSGQRSRWHAVRSDEQWTFLEGEPLELFTIGPDDAGPTRTVIGPLENGGVPFAVVNAGVWQAARPVGAYGLVSCTVGPGFDLADFRFLADDDLARRSLEPRLGPLRHLV